MNIDLDGMRFVDEDYRDKNGILAVLEEIGEREIEKAKKRKILRVKKKKMKRRVEGGKNV